MATYTNEKSRVGWDDLYLEYSELMNDLIRDNLNQKHNPHLIYFLFFGMAEALEKAKERMINIPGNPILKSDWFTKAERIESYSKQSDTLNKKVIAINMIDQFLRSTY